jgi:hypothetical protein
MSTFSKQKIKDTNKTSVIKLTGIFTDSVNEYNSSRISANTLYGALDTNDEPLSYGGTAKSSYETNIFRVIYFGNVTSRLFWSDGTTIGYFNKSGEYNLNGGDVRIKGSGNGDIGIETINASANNSYTMILEIHKGSGYDMGQYADPGPFNFGQYGVTPSDSDIVDELLTDTSDNLTTDTTTKILRK